ncbi:dual adapter for phosphotyrosine and 3-phosphotyrosine and 3-phosphoinositide [Anaeramoeba ignava]|uniref:Dual adapter for phosphotyrosine and 3-phosphotyrosine and 3-phosphoinositide n=1 Tax=Anaeramoeba ignava TaxID=1746090 RepID=A0A9Q0LIB7_ANAIG|nr:dual adapter for phosphotyrosine and 3-phosphotyrosine and 3-phosphoinositide [Anaeramoeba ignava]
MEPQFDFSPNLNKYPEIEHASQVIFVNKEGWINKQAYQRNNWRKRWFCLKSDRILYYYDSEDKKKLKNFVNLNQAKSVAINQTLQYGIEIHTLYRIFTFQASDEKEQFEWIDAIQCAISIAKKELKKFQHPEMRGYMKKQGGGYRSWKKRWFILKDSGLFYYKSPTDTSALGEVPLCDVKIVVNPKSKNAFSIAPIEESKRRTFNFRCKDENEKGNEQKKENLLSYNHKQVVELRRLSIFTPIQLKAKYDEWKEDHEKPNLSFEDIVSFLSGLTLSHRGIIRKLIEIIEHDSNNEIQIIDLFTSLIIISSGHPFEKIKVLFQELFGSVDLIKSQDFSKILSVWISLISSSQTETKTLVQKIIQEIRQQYSKTKTNFDLTLDQIFDLVFHNSRILQLLLIFDLGN